MQITVKMEGLDKVLDQLLKLSGPQLHQACANALNDVAYKLRGDMQAHMKSVFDSPTPWITNSPWIEKAKPQDGARMNASIMPTYRRDTPSATGGKAGVDPQQVLRAQEAGGPRRDKKSEVALRQAGVLPGGYQTAIPENPYPGSTDAYGNIRGAFMQQLLSYLQAFGEQGYKANMTARRKAQIHQGKAGQSGRHYFVSYGKLRSGRTSHLAPGIWAASGTHGVDVRPVLMFVRNPSYTPRLNIESLYGNNEDYMAQRLRYRIRQEAGV